MTFKNLRQNKGLTLRDVSKKINVSKSALYRYEKKQRFPDIIVLRRIQKLYQLNDEHISLLFLDYFRNKEV